MNQSKNTQNKQQVLITCRTHEMIQKEFPEYGKPDCPVPVKDFHITLGEMENKLQSNGFQLYIGDNVTYQDYLDMLKYLCENPLKEEVFNKTQDKVKETNKLKSYEPQ